MEKIINLSVHQLVDFLLRTGDLDNRVFNRSSMSEGVALHASYQNEQKSNYMAEYYLRHMFNVDGICIVLDGRADGIIQKSKKKFIVEEIKTTTIDLNIFKEENFAWHLGQAKCYAYMFMKEQNLDDIGIKLTYIRQGKSKDRLVQHYEFDFYELEQFVYSLLNEYLNFYNNVLRHIEERNRSINTLEFPFSSYRKGQKELMKATFGVAKKGGKLFVEAPTGIGKTMSTIFPYLKYLKEDELCKIFYLTAKGSGKESAFHALEILKEKGLIAHDVVITAKDKICFCKGKSCNPDECPYAKGYFNKIQSVLRECINKYSSFDLDLITKIAEENQMCPFELELDISLFCDVIIGDYNYMFDPISYMKRYFDEDSSHFISLVDEAHNLIDRSKDMYSASISTYTLNKAKKALRHSKNLKIKRQLAKFNKLFDEINLNYQDGNTIITDFSSDSYKIFRTFVDAYSTIAKDYYQDICKEFTDFYLEVNRFLKIRDLVLDNYCFYIHKQDKNISLHLCCLDTSNFLKSTMSKIKSTVLFSATMSPIDYYMDTLGGSFTNDPFLILNSPFDPNNLKLLVAPKVSIKYKDRESSYDIVCEYIHSFIKNKIGNYFIYVPSYEYLENIKNSKIFDDINLYVQQKEMDDTQRKEFLEHFENDPKQTNIGLMVLGGAFGEGIDLVSDRLIGAVIVGIGLPKINFESDQIVDYFNNKDKPGKDYAYINPGMNKVMQAVGRVIRSETDKGAVLLIDDRYMWKQYQNLYRVEWNNYQVVLTPEEVCEKIDKFFNK